MLQKTLTSGVILLVTWAGLLTANVQKRQSIYTGDDPHGLKVVGMPKARHKYSIIDLPSGTEVPAEYSTCGNGVYYQKERVRGIDFTAVMVHFKAEGDIDLTGDPPDPSKPRFKAGFETYVPQGWVALTFTLLRDSFTIQEIRLIRAFPRRPIPGTSMEYGSILVDPLVVRVDRSWVGKDPYVTWEILPESQLSHLIFRIRLPESVKACLQSKK
jgi:hypothetical protein